jgi:hypothetical protein
MTTLLAQPNASLLSADSFTTVARNKRHFMLNFKLNLTEILDNSRDANKRFLILTTLS